MNLYNILLVEDDDVDAMNIERSMQKLNILNPIHRCKNGEEALNFLKNNVLTFKPAIVFLDLSMPRMTGVEFLKELRADPNMRSMPVIVMTVSTETADKEQAYQYHVQGYVIKPIRFDDFIKVISAIDAYWGICELPPK